MSLNSSGLTCNWRGSIYAMSLINSSINAGGAPFATITTVGGTGAPWHGDEAAAHAWAAAIWSRAPTQRDQSTRGTLLAYGIAGFTENPSSPSKRGVMMSFSKLVKGGGVLSDPFISPSEYILWAVATLTGEVAAHAQGCCPRWETPSSLAQTCGCGQDECLLLTQATAISCRRRPTS